MTVVCILGAFVASLSTVSKAEKFTDELAILGVSRMDQSAALESKLIEEEVGLCEVILVLTTYEMVSRQEYMVLAHQIGITGTVVLKGGETFLWSIEPGYAGTVTDSKGELVYLVHPKIRAKQKDAPKGNGPVTETNDSVPEEFVVLPWPEGDCPDRFMANVKMVSLPAETCRRLLNQAGLGETPQTQPEFQTPREAAEYFGTHLNIFEAPKYMAVYTDASGAKSYLFSGGYHWRTKPIFSEGAILLESGEIRQFKSNSDE